MFQNKLSIKQLVRPVSLLLLALFFSASHAAPINYGDFSGTSVMYLDVTETANTPGDTEPLFSSPTVTGNTLDFNPKGFAASAGGGGVDITDGQLNFMLRSIAGSAINSVIISESGDYTLFGTGSAVTSVLAAASFSYVSVLEVDGVALANPLKLSSSSASFSLDLANNSGAASPWGLSLSVDVNAALTNAGVSFNGGATRLDVALDNILGAISEPSSLALIAKKDFKLEVITEAFPPNRDGLIENPITNVSAVPVPAAAWLFASGLIGLTAVSRRKHLTA
ncbi:MAG: VPLPA-CTERM sorting domain-containing protein [Gammaproteobacteria bacterium]